MHATAVEVDSATLRIQPSVRTQNLGGLPTVQSGNHFIISLPQTRRLKRLKLDGLISEGVTLRSANDLRSLRLAISFPAPDGGFGSPLFTVPPVEARGVLPSMFSGASFQNRVLEFASPTVPVSKVRLSLVPSSFPEDASPRPASLSTVTGVAAILPTDLELVGPEGSVVWAYPGELPPDAPVQEVDIRFGVEAALGAALSAGEPLDLTFRLRCREPSTLRLAVGAPRGSLVRAFPGVIQTPLEGDRRRIDFGERLTEPLAEERPRTVTADITGRYGGLRVLDTVSDSLPSEEGGIRGRVVTEAPVTKRLPPAALIGERPAKVGLIGRAPEACELSVTVVDMAVETPGSPLGPPGLVEVDPSPTIRTVWVDLPPLDPITGPVGISVQVLRGRFLWAAAEEPLARLAIRDSDPGGRHLRLDGTSIVQLEKKEEHRSAKTLPATAFHGSGGELTSDLFLTVDISDLTLRYARP